MLKANPIVLVIVCVTAIACDDAVGPERDHDSNRFIEIAAGDFHTCARTADGAVYCWGSNESGALGVPLEMDTTGPVHVPLPDRAESIEAGGGASCALVEGEAWCWGFLPGNGTTSSPISMASGIAWRDLVPSNRSDRTYLCGVAADSAAYCWGSQGSHLGTDSVAGSEPVLLPHTDWTFIAARSNATCGVRRDGAGYCWGRTPEFQEADVPQPVWPELAWQTLQPGSGFVCGLASSASPDAGHIRCWGRIASFEDRTSPVVSPHRAEKLAVGAEHVCTVDDGWLRCWGSNEHGQLGLGDWISRPNAALVDPTNRWVDVAAGMMHTCALDSDGGVWCWGSNARSQTGDGWLGDRFRPGRVAFGDD
ncbi:MAG TPA: hypothetical protein VF039_03495 [Longimicrobiales bacterium]